MQQLQPADFERYSNIELALLFNSVKSLPDTDEHFDLSENIYYIGSIRCGEEEFIDMIHELSQS